MIDKHQEVRLKIKTSKPEFNQGFRGFCCRKNMKKIYWAFCWRDLNSRIPQKVGSDSQSSRRGLHLSRRAERDFSRKRRSGRMSAPTWQYRTRYIYWYFLMMFKIKKTWSYNAFSDFINWKSGRFCVWTK